MPQLSVLTFPNKRLREKSLPLKDVPQSVRDLARDMFETMYLKNGIGLAAPQVGENIRLIVMDVPKQDTVDAEKWHSDPMALINPVILRSAGKIQYEEGCLSCPELIVQVERFAEISLGYWDLEGKPQEIILHELKGVCVQHEIDHLNGILLVDKITRMERDLYKNRRVRVAKSEQELKNIL